MSKYGIFFYSIDLYSPLLNVLIEIFLDSAPSTRQDFARDVIKAVAERQHIRRKLANIILQGLPGSGKTSLLDRLLNRSIRVYYPSTGISDTIVIVDISPTSTFSAAYACDDSSWKVVDFDESIVSQLDCYMEFIPGRPPVKSSLQSGNTIIVGDAPTEEGVSVITTEVHGNVRAVLKRYNIKSMADLQKTNSLYIRDTGGQVEFQESLSLLIRGPSIFLFVMKTSIDIHSKNVIQYRSPTGEISNTYQSSISTVDALLQFLTSVSAIQTTEDGNVQKDGTCQSHQPVVFIVGTHIDKLGSESNSVIDDMNKNLDELIRQHNFLGLVRYANGRQKKVMYLVDNTSEEDHHFQSLRSSINKYICDRKEFVIDYPVSYLLFCLELQSRKETVLSMETCKEMAAHFGIKSDEINSLFHFLHYRVGIIQHYDVEGLSDLIVKEPQVLFNKITDLLVNTFLRPGSINLTQEESFCQRGIMEASAFDNLFSKEDKITSQQFLSFLLHLRMAVPFMNRKGILQYFIPSVLNHVKKSTSDERRTDIAPLAITFEQGHCPKGLFGMLISHLINPEKNRQFTFDLVENEVYQDQVSLFVHSTEDVDKIRLTRHLSRIEISMFLEKRPTKTESPSFAAASRKRSPSEVCCSVRLILKDHLQLSLNALHYDCKKVGSMFSLVCPHKTCLRWHEVKKGEEDCHIHCLKFNTKHDVVGHWFKGTNTIQN